VSLPGKTKAKQWEFGIWFGVMQELDWLRGCLQVQDEATREVSITNTGKYPVRFDWSVHKERLKKLFTIEPFSGEVPAGCKVAVSITFNRGMTLQTELKLSSNMSVQLSIVEPLTGAQECVIPVTVRSPASHALEPSIPTWLTPSFCVCFPAL
jgi:hypothetical protein